MKICSIDEEGRFGGPQQRTIEIAKELRKMGIRTVVVLPHFDSKIFKKRLLKANIEFTLFKLSRLSLEIKILLKYIITFFLEIYQLYKHIAKNGYDLIQINGTPQYKGAIAGKLAGVKVIWIFEDTKMPKPIRLMTKIIAKYCAKGIIVTGQAVYDYYIKRSILETIPYAEIHAPVDTKYFDPKKTQSIKSMVKESEKNILSVSGVSPVKGLEYFIYMASELIKYNNDLSFHVSGAELSSQKKYSQKINEIIKNSNLNKGNYFFHGMISNVSNFLASGNIFVCTSVTEAGPMTVWEAMSMAKAVVTTDVGAVKQYIKDGVTGFIVPVGDTNALVKRVTDLLQNPGLIDSMGNAARIVAKEKLDVVPAAEKYFKFYENILYHN